MQDEISESNLQNLDWQILLRHLSTFATSERGREHLLATIPLETAELATSQFQQILETENILVGGSRPFMESLDLFSTWFQRLKKNATLKTIELKDVRHFLFEVLSARELIDQDLDPTSWLSTLLQQFLDAERPLHAIDAVMTPGGDIRSDASETLYNLHREKDTATRNIQNTLDKIVKDNEMEPVLQDRYVTNREGRWVLPVKSGMQHEFGGIIHAASQSKQTVFMEPEAIIPLNNRIRQIEVEIQEEIERLLTELSNYLSTLCEDISISRDILELLDVRFAQAQLSNQIGARAIQFSERKIQLFSLKHPILVLNGDQVISNTVELNADQRLLLLSGPNAGGKTVLLKSVGLAAHMARCGLPVCAAEDSSLPFFSSIHVGVGDAQSVDEQLSTFAAHLKVLGQATQAKGSDELLLIDEICGSTDPEEGGALARSFIESYAENQVFGVITSHLGPLKGGWPTNSGVRNGCMEYDTQNSTPTYRFTMGVPGDSLALQTARRVGVSEGILERTIELLSPEARQKLNLNEEIVELREQLEQMKQQLSKRIAESEKEKQLYLKKTAELERERDEKIEDAVKQAQADIEKMIRSAEVDQVFKKHSQLRDAKKNLPKIIKSSTRRQESSINSAEEFSQRFPAGSRVFVSTINQDGIVQGTANAKGEIPILSNSIRISVNWESLKPPRQSQNPTASAIRRSGQFGISLQESQRTLDLRGKNVETALQELEIQLDQASQMQEDRLKIIHGHGTETLKKAIRAYLSRSIYVTKWTTGSKMSGGDGVTWADIG